MRFVIDHDLHNHSLVSPCSADNRQTKEAVLAYALSNRFSLVGLTDHYWPQTREEVWSYLQEIPQSLSCRFLKGAEVDMDMNGEILLASSEISKLDFLILALTHVHLIGYVTDSSKTLTTPEKTAQYLKNRIQRMFLMDLPFDRVGLAHITWIPQPEGYHITQCLECFSQQEWEIIFGEIATRGMGVELNFDLDDYTTEELPIILRPYQIAKKMGCQFYLGGDAHHPEGFMKNRIRFERIVDVLELTEDDKWEYVKHNRVF